MTDWELRVCMIRVGNADGVDVDVIAEVNE